ncbi:MAG: Yop proteins translocation protein U [Chlamydiia bacterium]|nr:Yop proteins translocation protein U [Chlamydiia bacterium]MCH9615159.1 Yop proteins translocation protein U [Chlamydiia bacterium]MCH9628519.1 Yop proteins translocation protein U [Chlamydiia bacterium]
MAEKTEKATPKKLRDARKKGQVAKSKDFPAAFTFIVSISLVLGTSGYLFKMLAGFMLSMFSQVPEALSFEGKAHSYIMECIMIIFKTSFPIMFMTTLMGMLVSFLIVGPLFSFEAMKPDIKKLNPISNLKNMFKLKTFIELLKSIFKIAGAVLLIYSAIYNSLDEIIATAAMPIQGALAVFSSFLVKVILRVGIFFIAIAVFDLVFQKKNFAKEMKMEKYEVKQEMKDTEGNPEIKGKRRQIAQEIAYQEGPRSVKRASAVVTNPVHIAVAIEYDTETDPAPKICTMGKGVIAEKITEFALEYEVPIMRNVELAQELFETAEIGGFVPEDTYEAIAEILRWLEQLETTKEEHALEFLK